ncbi:RING finger protein 151 isoform X2 [Dermacentor silvarum]|nr:RING finger protein 151 isoform X2 [Dermacentor silvarum]
MARRRSSSSASSTPLCAVAELMLEDYDPRPDEELICVICHSVLREPVECPCRHVFCRRCISEWVRKNNSCPVCRKRAISAFTPALPLIQNMVNRLKVKCRNAGCDARVPAESFANHTSVCEFHEVICPHEACEHRCQRCMLESHVKQCPLREVTCDKGCGIVLTRDRLNTHSCVDELKRKLDEATSECDDWKRKAEDAMQALNRLRDTLHRLGDTAEGLENNLGDLGTRIRCAEAVAASWRHGRQSNAAVRASRVVHDGIVSSSTTSLHLGVLYGPRTSQLLEQVESDSDHSWSLRSDGSHESLRDVEELFLDLNS